MQESDKDPTLNSAERQQVNEALETILATDKFEAAPQMSAFLRYVVEQTADGNQSRIKAFTVAVDALGKPETFDPQNDPVVRVLAGRLRASLSAYNDENPDEPLVITMTPGSYVPTFLTRQTQSEAPIVDTDATTQTVNQSASENDDGAVPSTTVSPELNTSASTESIEDTASQLDNNEQTTAYIGSGAPQATTQQTADGATQLNPDATNATPAGLLNKLVLAITKAPKLVLATVLLASVVVALIKHGVDVPAEPDMQAAVVAGAGAGLTRPRPDEPSVFISAVDQGNALENSLNAVVSGVISESEKINVYRILDNDRETKFWPEDYILTLTALDLPQETRVNMQLMDATTGRIVHSEVVSLNELAFEQLTQEELTTLIDTARLIVSENGPLITDYSAKELAR